MKHGPRTILLKLLTILLSGSPCQWWTRQQLTAGSGQVRLQRSLDNGHVQPLLRAISVKTVEPAGTKQLKIFVMVNIKKFPREYTDQVISNPAARTATGACTWSGPKVSSFKHQASSFRTNLFNCQATSIPARVTSIKLQAGSYKLPDPRTIVHGYWRSFRGARTKGLCKDKSIVWVLNMEANLMWRKSKFVTFSYL